MSTSLPSLCIIGGGAAGTIALRVAIRSRRYGRIVIYEKAASGLGPGLWDYEGRSADSPLYADLRTNLPAMCMAIPGQLSDPPTHDELPGTYIVYGATRLLFPGRV